MSPTVQAALDRLEAQVWNIRDQTQGPILCDQMLADLALVRAALARQARLVALLGDRERMGRLLHDNDEENYRAHERIAWATRAEAAQDMWKTRGARFGAALLAVLDAPEGTQL